MSRPDSRAAFKYKCYKRRSKWNNGLTQENAKEAEWDSYR